MELGYQQVRHDIQHVHEGVESFNNVNCAF